LREYQFFHSRAFPDRQLKPLQFKIRLFNKIGTITMLNDLWWLIRNQQVAGSIPAGGSILKIKNFSTTHSLPNENWEQRGSRTSCGYIALGAATIPRNDISS
jgi:hypothetical protein